MMYYFILILSLIVPVHALPLTISQIIKKNSKNIPTFSFALAFAAIVYAATPPFGYDITRHWVHMQSLEGRSLTYIIENARFGYLFLDAYMWLLNKIGLYKDFLPASIVLIGYCLKLSLFKDFKLKGLQANPWNTNLLAFLSFWLPINFIALSSGLRSELATILVVYATYYLYKDNKKILFVTISLCSFFIHPFAIAPILLILIANYFSHLYRYGRLIVITSILLIFSNRLVEFIINYIAGFLKRFAFYSGKYFDAESATGGGLEQSLNIYGVITAVIIPKIPVIVALIYLSLLKIRNNNLLYVTLCIMSLYLGVFFSFYTLYSRMTAVFLHLFGLFIIIQYVKNKNRLNHLFLVLFIGSMLLFCFANIYVARNYIASAIDVLYKPILLIISGV